MDLDIYQVDSFTSEAFNGNPAGVCITKDRLSESLILLIAEEMAVPKTVLLSLKDMKLRWFTPIVWAWNTCSHSCVKRKRADKGW